MKNPFLWLYERYQHLTDPPVNRTVYPRQEYGEWEFVETSPESLIARVYSSPFTETAFTGPNRAKEARKWVHEHMYLVKKGE
jgi:hypothetical protein